MILIFFTDILNEAYKGIATTLLNNLEGMTRWSIDLEDIDKVLRVEATRDISTEIVVILTQSGFKCIYMV